MTRKASILHVITSLEQGGAQSALYRVVNADDLNRHIVVCLTGDDVFVERLQDCGAVVHCLQMASARQAPLMIVKLRRLIKQYQPEVVQTWMYHADLLGGLAAKSLRHKAIFWNIRHSDLSPDKTKKSTILVARMCAKLSSWVPNKIVCCAYRAQQAHQAMGYNAAKMVVIQNGIELDTWRESYQSGQAVRQELNVPADAFLLGAVGRFTAEKNYFGLLKALVIVQQQVDCHVLLVGEGLNSSNVELCSSIEQLGLNNIHLAGRRKDMVAIMNGLDVLVSASDSEGFPNVIAEAMACQTPCISTDAGDANYIVERHGWIVPIGDMQALAKAVIEANEKRLDDKSWADLRGQCRAHIEAHYSDDIMLANYLKLWASS